ncbi:MAG: lipopolysaccharide kinase InaA family protein, partial [Planctomycetota bacterium]
PTGHPTRRLTPPAHPLKVVRYARWGGYSPRQWAVALVRTEWDSDATCLKAGDRGTVWRARLALQKRELDCIVKVEPCAGFGEWVRVKLGLSRFHRQWSGAQALRDAGIPTGRPKALLLAGRGDDRRLVLVLDAVAGKTALEHLADGMDLATERRLAAAVGQNLAAMRTAGVRNRDHKPSNLVARAADLESDSGPLEVAVIDTMGIERGLSTKGDAPLWWHLACLMIEPAGVGCAPRRASRMRALRAVFDALHPNTRRKRRKWRAWRDAAWARVDGLVCAHGDATPVDDPLESA